MQSFLSPETHTRLGQLFLPGLFSYAALRSVARLYDEKGKPGSSYFFDRYDAKNRMPETFFGIIARRDLADHDPHFKSALWGIVTDS